MASVGFLLQEAQKAEALAQKYRDCLTRAKSLGQPDKKGRFIGPYGNAKDPIKGWHYSPRIEKALKDAENKASNLRQAILDIQQT